jgi:hypothetical protein
MSSPANLCASCRQARAIVSSRGSVFTRCERSNNDPRFPRYPTLPVLACPGYDADAPLVVEFAAGSVILREQDRASDLPMYRNGPPGTFVLLAGVRISLPTDQIIAINATDRTVTVAFGGMHFTGVEDGRLTFARVREVLPEEQLSPDRSHTMSLDTAWVKRVFEQGSQVWPVRDDASR